jgi:hypothetical protein
VTMHFKGKKKSENRVPIYFSVKSLVMFLSSQQVSVNEGDELDYWSRRFIKCVDSGVRFSTFKLWLYHILTVLPWASYSSLSFLGCKMG